MRNGGKLMATVAATLIVGEMAYGTHITSIDVAPANPVWPQPVRLLASGWEGYITNEFDHSLWRQEGSAIAWDLFFSGPDYGLPVVWEWSFEQPVGTLPPGVYSLEVRTCLSGLTTPSSPVLVDYRYKSFTVLPEPATLLLLALAGLAVMWRRDRPCP
jgi:hypothetical protein